MIKDIIKATLIGVLIGLMLVIGLLKAIETDTWKKYELALVAKGQGATEIQVTKNDVSFKMDGLSIRYTEFNNPIKGAGGR